MNEQTLSTMTPSLNAFLRAEGENDSADVLAELFEKIIDPQVKSLVRNKLHVTLQADDDRRVNQDALDLLGNIRTLIIAKLVSLRSGEGHQRIEDLEAYIRAVASNSINHHLRQKYPRRLRLKNQLRYLLSHDVRFATWNGEDGEWLCGRAGSKNVETREVPMSQSQLMERSARVLEKMQEPPDRSSISEIVPFILEDMSAPARFRDLVSALYELMRIKEPAEVSEDEGRHTVGRNTKLQERLENAAFLKQLWDAIGELPLRHRAALLLNLRNREGEGLITMLPLTRVASIRQIADRLEFPLDEFARIWPELPWDDNTVAKYLGLTRQQVINLRQSARSTLRRRLNY